MQPRKNRFRLVIGLAAIGCLLSVASAVAGQVAPAGKNYALVLLIREPDGPFEVAFECLRFTTDEMCTEEGLCGPWRHDTGTGMGMGMGLHNSWTAELVMADAETGPIEVTLYGHTERAGRKSSIGGTVLFQAEGFRANGAFAGTRVRNRVCSEFAQDDGDQ